MQTITTSRYERQEELVPLSKLKDTNVHVVGCGAGGRQLAIQLASMGVPKITLWDFDTVEIVNLAPQGFRESDLDKPKVHAVKEVMESMNSDIEIHVNERRFQASHVSEGDIIFSCVDNMRSRKFIYERCRDRFELFVDGRMSGEMMRVFTALRDDEAYSETLFSDDVAYQGRCTARSTIYSASILAGIKISMMTKHLRGFPLPPELSFNLLTLELD